MELVVPDEKLSLAIGKKGQNVRLASQLTGWRIDIHSESKIYELERRAKEQIASIAGVSNDLAETMFKLGWRSVTELSRAAAEELAGVPGIGGVDGARKIIQGANEYLQSSRRRPDDLRRENERRSAMSGEQQLLEVPGVNEEVVQILASAQVHSPEQLVKMPLEELASATNIDMSDLAKLRQRVIAYLSQVE
jgi:N utilization substance protein A